MSCRRAVALERMAIFHKDGHCGVEDGLGVIEDVYRTSGVVIPEVGRSCKDGLSAIKSVGDNFKPLQARQLQYPRPQSVIGRAASV